MKIKLISSLFLTLAFFNINAQSINVDSFIANQRDVCGAQLKSLNAREICDENNARIKMYTEALSKLDTLQATLSSEKDNHRIAQKLSEYESWYLSNHHDISVKFTPLSMKVLRTCINGGLYTYNHPYKVMGGTLLVSAILYGAYKWYQAHISSKRKKEDISNK
jgi:hypothetical protein